MAYFSMYSKVEQRNHWLSYEWKPKTYEQNYLPDSEDCCIKTEQILYPRFPSRPTMCCTGNSHRSKMLLSLANVFLTSKWSLDGKDRLHPRVHRNWQERPFVQIGGIHLRCSNIPRDFHEETMKQAACYDVLQRWHVRPLFATEHGFAHAFCWICRELLQKVNAVAHHVMEQKISLATKYIWHRHEGMVCICAKFIRETAKTHKHGLTQNPAVVSTVLGTRDCDSTAMTSVLVSAFYFGTCRVLL